MLSDIFKTKISFGWA